MKERFTYIDSLRGLAIVGVIITHTASITHLKGILEKVTVVGGMGVQLFFVISAFTIFYSLDRSIGKENQFRDFFIRRLFRIIPVYWLGIILYTSVFGLGSRGWREGPELWHYPWHIFLVNVMHPLTSSSVVPGGWSISCEVLFYAIVPLLFTYITNTRNLVAFTILCIVVIPIANSQINPIITKQFFSAVDEKNMSVYYYRWLPSQIGCFAFGMWLFRFIKAKNFETFLNNKRYNFVAFCIVLLLIVSPLPGKLLFQKHHVYSFLFMLLALLLSAIPWKLIVNPVLVFLGKISYSCYLIHFLVIKQVYDASLYFMPSLTSNYLLHFFVVTCSAFVLTIPLSYLSYTFIELPAQKAGKALIQKLNYQNVAPDSPLQNN